MGFCSSLSVCTLVIINVVVFLLGLAITVFGALAQWGGAAFTKQIATKAADLSGPPGQINFDEIINIMGQYIKYLGAAGLAIFIFGLILMVISLCGLCGACKKSKLFLVIYVILMVVLLLALVALTVAMGVARGYLQSMGLKTLDEYIINKFTGLDPTKANAQSAILSLIQARFSCCGVMNGTDFDNAKNWNKTYTFNGTVYNLVYPASCCKMKKASYDVVDRNCFTAPNTTNSNYKVGCWDKIWNLIDSYAWFVIYGLVGLDLFLLLLIILSVIIVRSVEDESKSV